MNGCGTTNQNGRAPLTELLQRSADGDEAAQAAVWSRVHSELRLIAEQRLRREYGAVELQPTELVHEAFLKLFGAPVRLSDRQHFLALAASAMRQILVDEARARNRAKRGGGQRPLTLNSRWMDSEKHPTLDLLDLHRALVELRRLDPRKAQAVELSYFGGMTDDEVGTALSLSPSTVKRDLRMARAYLKSELSG